MEVCPDEVHKFLTRIGIFQKCSGELRSGHDGILFLNPPHGHTQVLGFDYHGNPDGIQYLLKAVFNLGSESFLQLQSAGIGINHAWNFA